MKFDNVKLFFLARGFSQVYFLIVIAVPYYLYRGLSLQEAYSLIAVYGLFVLLLEYPTGVIGDHYGHKISQMVGNCFGIIAMLVLSLDAPIPVYYVAMVFNALGNSLISGSDEATLKKISTNFRKDYKFLKTLDTLVLVIVAFSAGYIANISFELTLYLSALAYFIGNILYLFVHEDNSLNISNKEKGNIFSTANKGLREVFKSKSIFALVLILSILGMYRASVKNMVGSFEELFAVDVSLIGLVIGISMLTRTFGTWFYDKFEWLSLKSLIVIISLSLGIGFIDTHFLIPTIAMMISVTITAIVLMRLNLDLNEKIGDETRAGILSFKNVLERILSSGYAYIFGLLLTVTHLGPILLGLSAILLATSIAYIKINTRFEE